MLEEMKLRLINCQDIVYREIESDNGIITVIYTDGLANVDLINEAIIKPLSLGRSITAPEIDEIENIDKIIEAIFSGDAIICSENNNIIYAVSVKGWQSRSISESSTEKLIRGAKDSFVESFRFNTALVRRRIKDSNLKLEQQVVGRRSQTSIGIFYIKDIAHTELVDEVKRRISKIDIDGILDSGYIEQLIEDDPYSPFPQIKATERPDVVSAALLEGRVAIIIDNTPFALIAPVTLNMLYHSPEDFYDRFLIASIIRLIRIIASLIAILLPAMYIAMAAYTPAILPTELLLQLAAAREGIVCSVIGEAFTMEIVLELLREASIRMPSAVGSTIGIVGGLVIGQTAVEAHLVSPIMVIITAITAIANFAIPSYSLSTGYRLSKFLLMALTAVLGLFGLQIGILLLLSHLSILKSFGVPYLHPFVATSISDMKDSIIRMPIFTMRKRPVLLTENKIRQNIRKRSKNDKQ